MHVVIVLHKEISRGGSRISSWGGGAHLKKIIFFSNFRGARAGCAPRPPGSAPDIHLVQTCSGAVVAVIVC